MTDVARSNRGSAATRTSLLAAARSVFAASGFADANIADVVAAANASVGSLYHHFGGKADLYLALFEDFQQAQEARAVAAVDIARAAGVTEPLALFLAGSRAYLRGCWADRDLARVFLDGGGPPGVELIARRRYREWIRQNSSLLHAEAQPLGETLVILLTSVVAEAGREVTMLESIEDAERLAEEFLTLLARIGRD